MSSDFMFQLLLAFPHCGITSEQMKLLVKETQENRPKDKLREGKHIYKQKDRKMDLHSILNIHLFVAIKLSADNKS